MRTLDRFMEMLCGTFDNRDQLLRESLAGLPVHPGARHIIGICNDKIDNLPEDFNGYFVIEESRFDLEDQRIEKHYLFLYDEDEQGCIRLTSYNIPEEIPKESFTNDNPAISLDYLKLEVSPRFQPLKLREEDGVFQGENCSRFSADTTFLFSLSVSAERLLVKELLLRGTERVAGYEEPVEYIRLQGYNKAKRANRV